jgi:hypothetical protein
MIGLYIGRAGQDRGCLVKDNVQEAHETSFDKNTVGIVKKDRGRQYGS